MIKVYYHASCKDGWVAALQAWKAFGEEAQYIPIQYGDNLVYEESDILYFLDFCPNSIPTDCHVVILDHHRTAMNNYGIEPQITRFHEEEKGLEVLFDVRESGATLARTYFKEEPSWLVDYARDHDLWQFKLPDSKAIKFGLEMWSFEETPENKQCWLQLDKEKVIQQGYVIMDYVQTKVRSIASRAVSVRFFDGDSVFNGLIVNNGLWTSEVGEALTEDGTSWGASYFRVDNGWVFSVRGFYARKVAEAFGGGGHDGAAGFKLDTEAFERMVGSGEFVAR